jgi:hypothetical protein
VLRGVVLPRSNFYTHGIDLLPGWLGERASEAADCKWKIRPTAAAKLTFRFTKAKLIFHFGLAPQLTLDRFLACAGWRATVLVLLACVRYVG